MDIIAVSDLHGHLPDIPPCDLLLLGGDICPDFFPGSGGLAQRRWLHETFLPWIERQPAKQWWGTWGNHDWIEDPLYHFVVDELVEAKDIKIWFSPWSNLFGHWAWMDGHKQLGLRYNQIPACDILVSHQPAYGYCDVADPRYMIGSRPDEHLGSIELRSTLHRLEPDVFICGHIHGGFGGATCGRTSIYNVALVNEAYQPVNGVTRITYAQNQNPRQPAADGPEQASDAAAAADRG